MEPKLFWNRHSFLYMLINAVSLKGAALNNCFGFLDGTVRPICIPGEHQRVVNNGHERVHALKFQSTALPNGLIANMYGPVGEYICYSSILFFKGRTPLFVQDKMQYIYGIIDNKGSFLKQILAISLFWMSVNQLLYCHFFKVRKSHLYSNSLPRSNEYKTFIM